MNTYRICFALIAVIAFGCSKSESEPIPTDDGPNVDADYAVLVQSNGILSETLLNANAETITINPTSGSFESTSKPEHSYREGNILSFYNGAQNCTGELSKVDFSDHSTKKIQVFDDLQDCEMEVIAMAHSPEAIFMVYSIPGLGLKEEHHFIRTVSTLSDEGTFTELELEKEPKQIVFANNKVFILSVDADEENKFALVVFDPEEGELIHDLNLDFDAQRIYKTVDNNIMVSYPELHLVVNSTSMGVVNTVRYNEGKEPKFGYTEAAFFDALGNLYYPMPTDLSGTSYPNIPGVYDFSTNTAVLYFFENFLTEAEREFEFKIGDTSMVSYDAANNLILIGYQKSDDVNKGGLLRIKPIPDPKFIDNIDLDGVPVELFVN
ncbi:MAG: hypothetical protein AB3N14_19025 [Flavobacteriaceae bacterium]